MLFEPMNWSLMDRRTGRMYIAGFWRIALGRNARAKSAGGLGIHVMIFRGAERNRRRGFHNIYVFNQQLQGHLEQGLECVS